MTELLNQALDWVNQNPGWAGLLVFLMAFSESLAVVGILVPGVVILFGVGVMIGAGALDFGSMVAWAVAGAVLGDGLSFWLGRFYSDRLTSMWPLKNHPDSVARGVRFFERFGGKSVALGRFFGPVRAIIPLVAGMLGMSPVRFTVANVLSALVWAPAYLLPGMAFGATLELASEVALRLVLFLVSMIAVLWLFGWAAHRAFLLLAPQAQFLLSKLLQLGQNHRGIRKMANALADPNHPEAAGLGMLAGLLAACSILLTLVALVAGDTLVTADRALQLISQELSTPTSDHLMLALSMMASSTTSMVILVTVGILFHAFHQPLAAKHWWFGFGSIWLLTAFGEYWLSSNPAMIPVVPDVYIIRATVQFGLLAVLISKPIPAAHRWLAYSFATILMVTVLLAQLYHGSSSFAVSNALFTGILWTTIIGVAYRTHGVGEQDRLLPTLVITITSMLLITLSSATTPRPMAMPSLASSPVLLDSSQWWNTGWQHLPLTRDDVARDNQQPLNLQFAGKPSILSEALENNGWQAADKVRAVDWLSLLSVSLELDRFPVFPRSHGGRYDELRMVRINDDGTRLVLRLWPSRYQIGAPQHPLWLGSIRSQKIQRQAGLVSFPRPTGDPQQALLILEKSLQASALTYHSVNNQTIILIRQE
ncbi:MAG: VTT domain-containing protein [bacterium]